MKKDEITVGLADIKVLRDDKVLVAYALGSCVAVMLYDPVSKVSGLAHVMLPCKNSQADFKEGKFADTAIDALIRKMKIKGAIEKRIVAKITGGANMFNLSSDNTVNIGQKNIDKVKEVLRLKNIFIKAEDTGGNFARTIRFYTDTGKVKVSSSKFGTKLI